MGLRPREAPRCVLRPLGAGETINEAQVNRYLAFIGSSNLDTLGSADFAKQAREELDRALASAVVNSLAVLGENLQNSISEELCQDGALGAILNAFHKVEDDRHRGLTLDSFPEFLRFCLAFRTHCYFHPSPCEPGPIVDRAPSRIEESVESKAEERASKVVTPSAALFASKGPSILAGYTEARKDLPVVIRSGSADLQIARTISTALTAYSLKAHAELCGPPSEEEITVWLVTPFLTGHSLAVAEENCKAADADENKDKNANSVLLLVRGMVLNEWMGRIVQGDSKVKPVNIGETFPSLQRMQDDELDLMEVEWMASLWSTIISLQGVRTYANQKELCQAIDRFALHPVKCPFQDRVRTTKEDGTPFLVGFIGSTVFYKKWVCELLRKVAKELMRINLLDTTRELVVITGGFRNMEQRHNEDNQGAGYTVAKEYFDLGGHVFHLLPAEAREKNYSVNADHMKDGCFLPAECGMTLFTGKGNWERLNVMSQCCDIIFLLEGAAGSVTQAQVVDRVKFVCFQHTPHQPCKEFIQDSMLTGIDVAIHAFIFLWAQPASTC